MIDTIRLAYPVDDELREIVRSRSTRLVKLSASGEIIWDRGFAQDELPSHFSGLRIFVQEASDLRKSGFRNCRSEVFFEFSVHKYLSPCGYNHKNYTLAESMAALYEWIDTLSAELSYPFGPILFRVTRCDLAQNYHLLNGSVVDYLRSLELKLSRYHQADEKLQRFGTAICYGSSWVGRKIYGKYAEFMDVERKKRRSMYTDGYIAGESESFQAADVKRGLTFQEINDMRTMLRFEVGFKSAYLRRHGRDSIVSIPDLLAEFEHQQSKYMTIERLREGVTLSPVESFVVDLVKRHGKQQARNIFLEQRSERSWYRVQRCLAQKNIDLDCILNEAYRAEIASADAVTHYELRLAA